MVALEGQSTTPMEANGEREQKVNQARTEDNAGDIRPLLIIHRGRDTCQATATGLHGGNSSVWELGHGGHFGHNDAGAW